MRSIISRWLIQGCFYFALALSAAAGLNAQEVPLALQVRGIDAPLIQRLVLPGTHYEIVLGKGGFRPVTTPEGQALLSAIVTWLSANFEISAADEHPQIAFTSPAKIAALRYKGLLPDRRPDGAIGDVVPPGQREPVAVYHDATRTIYLPEGWTGSTPAELSVLVHELVHHLQNVGMLKYECPQAREKLAYVAQERWLRLFGGGLLDDFAIDPFTVLVSSLCSY